jgi:hypothetical protein
MTTIPTCSDHDSTDELVSNWSESSEIRFMQEVEDYIGDPNTWSSEEEQNSLNQQNTSDSEINIFQVDDINHELHEPDELYFMHEISDTLHDSESSGSYHDFTVEAAELSTFPYESKEGGL